jgi:hypothetical protein
VELARQLEPARADRVVAPAQQYQQQVDQCHKGPLCRNGPPAGHQQPGRFRALVNALLVPS